jgi:hypothetical protein
MPIERLQQYQRQLHSLQRHIEYDEHFYFEAMTLICCLLDACGRIIGAGRTTPNDDSIIGILSLFENKEYMRQGLVIPEVYRNGLLHEGGPKRVIVKISGENIENKWYLSINNKNNKYKHLGVRKEDSDLIIEINIDTLINDFIHAIERLIIQIQNESQFRKACLQNCLHLEEPILIDSANSKSSYHRKLARVLEHIFSKL